MYRCRQKLHEKLKKNNPFEKILLYKVMWIGVKLILGDSTCIVIFFWYDWIVKFLEYV